MHVLSSETPVDACAILLNEQTNYVTPVDACAIFWNACALNEQTNYVTPVGLLVRLFMSVCHSVSSLSLPTVLHPNYLLFMCLSVCVYIFITNQPMHLLYCSLSLSLLAPSFVYNSMCYLLKFVCDEQTNKLCKAFLDCVFDCLCLSAILFPFLSLSLASTRGRTTMQGASSQFLFFICVWVCV